MLDDVAQVLANRDPHAGKLSGDTRVLGLLGLAAPHGGERASRRMESAVGDSRRLPAFTLRRGIAYQEMMARWLDELREFVEAPA